MKLDFLKRVFSIREYEATLIICVLGINIKISGKPFSKLFYSHLPINNRKIVFDNYKGGSYGCNPKYITEEILKRKLPYEIVWLVNNPEQKSRNLDFPPEVRLVDYQSLKALRELMSAKLWVDNHRKILHGQKGLQKRDGQFYIQTWHGSLGIKRVGIDVPQNPDSDVSWMKYGIKDSEMIDFSISNSEFEDEVFKNNFWNNTEIKRLGHPRNDIFFRDYSDIKQKIFRMYNIEADFHTVLYVPSFRDDKRLWCFNLEYDNLIKTLEEKYSGKWVLLVRFHPKTKKYKDVLLPKRDNIIDVSDYADIQELLVVADAAVTDYSSCIFDFMLSKKPGFIYASDYDEFNNDRGFYYPLEAAPFPVAHSNEELRNNILNFDYKSYEKKVQEFLINKGCIDDGHASERVVDLIEEIMDGE